MSRIEISREDQKLTIAFPAGERLLTMGCVWLAVSVLCVLVVGFLSFALGDHPTAHGSVEPFESFEPTTNSFEFLWAIGSALLVVLLPIYVYLAYGAGVIFAFDQGAGQFLRNGKPVTALRRIEYVLIRTLVEPDESLSFRLFIVYGDGYEMLVLDTFDEREAQSLAETIAGFLPARLVWK